MHRFIQCSKICPFRITVYKMKSTSQYARTYFKILSQAFDITSRLRLKPQNKSHSCKETNAIPHMTLLHHFIAETQRSTHWSPAWTEIVSVFVLSKDTLRSCDMSENTDDKNATQGWPSDCIEDDDWFEQATHLWSLKFQWHAYYLHIGYCSIGVQRAETSIHTSLWRTWSNLPNTHSTNNAHCSHPNPSLIFNRCITTTSAIPWNIETEFSWQHHATRKGTKNPQLIQTARYRWNLHVNATLN